MVSCSKLSEASSSKFEYATEHKVQGSYFHSESHVIFCQYVYDVDTINLSCAKCARNPPKGMLYPSHFHQECRVSVILHSPSGS
ncbi:hypothetical protein ABKN59_010777 [Abortiporus biennis]